MDLFILNFLQLPYIVFKNQLIYATCYMFEVQSSHNTNGKQRTICIAEKQIGASKIPL